MFVWKAREWGRVWKIGKTHLSSTGFSPDAQNIRGSQEAGSWGLGPSPTAFRCISRELWSKSGPGWLTDCLCERSRCSPRLLQSDPALAEEWRSEDRRFSDCGFVSFSLALPLKLKKKNRLKKNSKFKTFKRQMITNLVISLIDFYPIKWNAGSLSENQETEQWRKREGWFPSGCC